MFLRIIPLFFTAAALHAAPRFVGPVHWDFDQTKNNVVLSATKIENNDRENATGTIKLELWATAVPFAPHVTGTRLASVKLDGLKGGHHYSAVRKTIPYSPPSAKGTYFIAMVLLEYRAGAYVIAHSLTMKGKSTLGPLPLFSLEGPAGFQSSIEGGTVEMTAAKISHRRTGNTGSLKLGVWLTNSPYRGGKLIGHLLGEVMKEPLKPGYAYTNVKNVAKYIPPAAGDYYTCLVLSEKRSEGFVVVDWINFEKINHFNAPSQ